MRSRFPSGARLLWVALALCACQPSPEPSVPRLPQLAGREVVRLIPAEVSDRRGWAEAVLSAFDANGLWPDAPSVCSVLAVVQQESGFQANPVVPELASVVSHEIDRRLRGTAPVSRPLMNELLKGRAPGAKETFEQRLAKVRTEQDVDKLFRDLLEYYRLRYPGAYGAVDLASSLMGKGSLSDQNPITTAGSMQVSVAFSEELANKQEHGQGVRDELYTRAGGVHYGTARLLGYRAAYERAIFRFADYNAGLYASRNAAFQAELSALTGLPLTCDGDLLAYGPRGDPRPEQSHTLLALLAFRARYAPAISDWQLRREVRLEKEASFEQTDLWRAVRKAYEERLHRPAPYARIPDVAIRSPKMRKERSTAWFARSVDSHYQRCMAKNAQPAESPAR